MGKKESKQAMFLNLRVPFLGESLVAGLALESQDNPMKDILFILPVEKKTKAQSC